GRLAVGGAATLGVMGGASPASAGATGARPPAPGVKVPRAGGPKSLGPVEGIGLGGKLGVVSGILEFGVTWAMFWAHGKVCDMIDSVVDSNGTEMSTKGLSQEELESALTPLDKGKGGG